MSNMTSCKKINNKQYISSDPMGDVYLLKRKNRLKCEYRKATSEYLCEIDFSFDNEKSK